MIIRRAEPRDLPDFLRMGKAFVAYTPIGDHVEYDHDGFTAFITEGSQQDHMIFLVADDDGKIVGCSAAVIFPFFCAPNHRMAQELFWWVDPEARGGVAALKMLRELERWAKACGADSMNMIHLHNAEMGRVKSLYKRCGYTELEYTYTKRL